MKGLLLVVYVDPTWSCIPSASHVYNSLPLCIFSKMLSFTPYSNMVDLGHILKCSSSRETLPTDLSMRRKYGSYPLRSDFKHLSHWEIFQQKFLPHHYHNIVFYLSFHTYHYLNMHCLCICSYYYIFNLNRRSMMSLAHHLSLNS